MILIFTKSFNTSLKQLKKHYEETNRLNKIINYLEIVDNFNELEKNPISNMYGFERLKYELSEYYSLRLSSIIRLIIKPKDNIYYVYLVYISMKHYNDFSISKVILDEKE